MSERKGSAYRPVGKEELDFDFFNLRRAMEAWPFNTHRKAYVIATQQTLFNPLRATSAKVSAQKLVYKWGISTCPIPGLW